MAKPEEESLDQHPETVGTVGMMKTAVNWGVAALSFAVIGSFVIWMVNLGLRDPHDVPIVRAMEGPSRVAPTDPGGKQALHQGLAVNSVQSEGGVASLDWNRPGLGVELSADATLFREVFCVGRGQVQ